ncbi:MAG TPA: sialidase family protein [Candidatus Polarisedimenticolia bacterium]|nr:sialidase family protein [Candidatus Polarisedimenticolia bacterium]
MRTPKRFIWIVAALAAAMLALGAAPAAPDVRVNIITAEEQAETTLVINPTNPQNLFAAWRDLRAGRAGIGYAASFDGGVTWSGGIVDDPAADIQYDPSVAADLLGNFYLAYGVDTPPPVILSKTLVVKSTDGGLTLGTPVSAGPFVDKPFIGVDRLSNAVYVAGNAPAARGQGGDLFITRSSDGGATFGPLVKAGNNIGAVNAPAFGPNGEVYLAWPHYKGKARKVLFNRSLDGGVTWMSKDVEVNSVKNTPSLLNGGIDAGHLVAIAADAGAGPSGGNIYIVWHTGGNGGEDVVLSRSTDGGTTWSAPMRINDDPTGTSTDQFLPWVNVDDAGRVLVTWLDRRDDPANVAFGLYLAVSTNGGVTFVPNVRISDGSFAPSPSTVFVGDYNQGDARGGVFHAIWADGRNGNMDVFTEAVPVP